MSTIPPLSTFSALCIEVADWLDRPSINDAANQDVILNRPTLGPLAPTLVRLAEVQMGRRLDTRQMVNTISIVLDSDGGFDLPDDFGGMDALALNSNVNGYNGQWFPKLIGTSQNAISEMNALQYQYEGLPGFYAVTADRVQFSPSQSYFDYGVPITGTMTYRRTLPPLSSINPSNWMLQANPDVYLWGSLAAAAPYLRDDERIGVWADLFSGSLSDVGIEAMRQEQPSALRMRAAVYV